MTIDALPPPPEPTDSRSAFTAKAFSLVASLASFVTQANALQADVNGKQTQTATDAAAAAASMADAQAAAAAAAEASTSTAWVSGAAYADGAVVWSQVTYLSYRRKGAGAGTTDPSVDTANWQLASQHPIGNLFVIGTDTSAAISTTYVLTASLTLTLPATPNSGDWVGVQNSSGTTTAVIERNGENIMSLAEDLTVDSTNAAFKLVYADATRGWVIV